jgi:hypothetical protein
MTLKGRSHYWAIWVSLANRQIEYATLNEDVLGELTLTGPGRRRGRSASCGAALRAANRDARGGRMTPIGRGRLLLVLNASTTVLVP